jgi:pSer/pThr/pTyr-binding forkhead associated (FHA) protein
MALTIVVRSGTTEPAPQITLDAPRIVIGRGEGCEVRLPDPSVSHRHASIRQRGSEYIVMDEGSTNGTFVGPVRLSPQAPRVLKNGDLIRIGRIWLETRIEQVPPTQNVAIATKELALGLVANALAAQGESPTVKVSVVEGPQAEKHLDVDLFDHPYVIGRAQDADLALDDEDLSRRHMELLRRGERLFVKDLGSKNGSRLGDKPLPPNQEVHWKPSDALHLGSHRLSYTDPVKEALEELERAADERIRNEDAIEPPSPAETPDEEQAAPLAPAAARKPRSHRPKSKKVGGSGWNATDVLVAFVAIVVLAMSLVGLFWLMRNG